MAELNDVELADFNEIVKETIESLCICADNHNIDRDSFICYFASVFSVMAEISTFEHFGEEGEGE